MTAEPTATTITVAETLSKLNGEFEAVAQAVETGEFALWVGSGISRHAPDLGALISRALESLRQSAMSADAPPEFVAALKEAITIAKVPWDNVAPYLPSQFKSWPEASKITGELWERYSELLDIRIPGKDDDYMLWEAVGVREAFANPATPACEHLCIAILILEGAVTEVASANWDGFIEAAIERLSGGAAGILQVVVDPNHLRDRPGRARLLKFHGCIVHATQDPKLYRAFLIAAASQITTWTTLEAYKAIRTEAVSVATNKKTLMVGLSVQDSNLQWTFSEARSALKWPWPCAPSAQGHVFCENAIGLKQKAMLKVVYGDLYTPNQVDIEKSALLQSWPEQVLLALVIRLLCGKLSLLAENVLTGTVLQPEMALIIDDLIALRDKVAGTATGDRTAFINVAIGAWSRGLGLFRSGRLPGSTETYETLSVTGVAQLSADANALMSGLGEAAVGLALLGHGQTSGDWTLNTPATGLLVDGALQVTASWAGAKQVCVFFVRGASEAIELGRQGAFGNANVVVVHSDDAWAQMRNGGASARRPTRAPGRTGAVSARHVSIRELVGSAASMATLVTKFKERAGL